MSAAPTAGMEFAEAIQNEFIPRLDDATSLTMEARFTQSVVGIFEHSGSALLRREHKWCLCSRRGRGEPVLSRVELIAMYPVATALRMDQLAARRESAPPLRYQHLWQLRRMPAVSSKSGPRI